jgi:hypothetical protein
MIVGFKMRGRRTVERMRRAELLAKLARSCFETDDWFLKAIVALDDGEYEDEWDEPLPPAFVEAVDGHLCRHDLFELYWDEPLSSSSAIIGVIYSPRLQCGVVFVDSRVATGIIEFCDVVEASGERLSAESVQAAVSKWIRLAGPRVPVVLLNVKPGLVTEDVVRAAFAQSPAYKGNEGELEEDWGRYTEDLSARPW